MREGQRWLLTPRAEALAAQLADSLGALERLYEAPEFAPPSAASGCFGSPPPTTWPSTSCRTSVRPWRGPPPGGAGVQPVGQAPVAPALAIGAGHGLHHHGAGAGPDPRPASGEGQAGGADGAPSPALWHGAQPGGLPRLAPPAGERGRGQGQPVEQVLAPRALPPLVARVPFFQAAVEVLLRTDCLMTTPAHIAWQLSREHALSFAISPSPPGPAVSSAVAPAPPPGSGSPLVSRAGLSLPAGSPAIHPGESRKAVGPGPQASR